MPTTEQMIVAAYRKVSFERMAKALDAFLPAVFAEIEDENIVSAQLPQTPINNGLIAATVALQKSGWADADVAIMGIRLYRSFLVLQDVAPSPGYIHKSDTGKPCVDENLIQLIAATPMHYDAEKGVAVFDSTWLREALLSAANICKNPN